MTQPLRKPLLNAQIALEARAIAHRFTRSCLRFDVLRTTTSSDDDDHTKACNDLKRQIQDLAMGVKLATLQGHSFRHSKAIKKGAGDEDPPPVSLEPLNC
jgi:hypothetical protein